MRFSFVPPMLLMVIVMVMVVIGCSGIQAASSADEPANLLKNPGGEAGKDAQVDGWAPIAVPVGSKDGRLARVMDQKHSGKAALMSEVVRGDGFVQWVQNVDRFPRGATMRLSGFIKSRGDNVKAHIQLQAFDQAGQQIAIAGSAPRIEGTQEWTKVETEATAIPAEAKSVVIRLVLSGKGRAWFDDVVLAAEPYGGAARNGQ
jgi:hypothetical protein